MKKINKMEKKKKKMKKEEEEEKKIDYFIGCTFMVGTCTIITTKLRVTLPQCH